MLYGPSSPLATSYRCQAGLEPGEEVVVADQGPVARTGSAYALMGGSPGPVVFDPGRSHYSFARPGALFQQRLLFRFPRGVGTHPDRGVGPLLAQGSVQTCAPVDAGHDRAAIRFNPSRANLVCWPFGAGGGEDLAGGAGQRVGGDVGVTGDDDGDLLQRA